MNPSEDSGSRPSIQFENWNPAVLASLFLDAPIATALVSPDSRFVRVNRAFCHLFGYEESELLRLTFRDITHPDDIASSLEQVGKLISGEQESFQIDKRYRRKDGRVVWGRVSVSLVRDPAGRPLYILPTIQDVTERITSREQLEQSNRDWKNTFDALNDAVWLLDPEQRIRRCNRAAEKLFQREPQDMLGRPCWEIVHGTSAPIPECPVVKMQKSRQRESAELRVGDRWFNVTVDPVFDAENRVSGAVHIVSDITSGKRAEAVLRYSQKMEAVEQLAGGMAHEFNNIMAAMMLNLDLLKDRAAEVNLDDSLQEMTRLSRRASELIRMILAFSGQSALRPESIDLEKSLQSAAGMLRQALGGEIRLELTFEAGLPHCTLDRSLLEQVLIQLCLNARDAMPGGGLVSISLKKEILETLDPEAPAGARPGRFVVLSVADTGCGMDAYTLAHLFEPFFTTKDVGRGTGLHLAAVHGIVQQHGGWIRVASQPGQGTTFQLFFPAGEPVPARPAPTTAGQARGGSRTLLLVEDEPVVRNLVALFLERQGYRVLKAGTGTEADLLWEKHRARIEVLLSDVVLPGGPGGHELCRKFLADKPGLRVILSSGYNTHFSRMRELQESGVRLLAKPFSAEELLGALNAILPAPAS
ncbi:MAG: PAS domain S-box protein [Verrucomicrobiota bacterium]